MPPGLHIISHEYPHYAYLDPRGNTGDADGTVGLSYIDRRRVSLQDSPSPTSSSSSSAQAQYYPPGNAPPRVHPYPQSLPSNRQGVVRSQSTYRSIPLGTCRPEPFQTVKAAVVYGPAWPPSPATSSDEDKETILGDEEDPESLKIVQVMCTAPVPDANSPSNALPFVLQCYARWVNFVVFDPLRVIGAMKDGVINQFSNSEAARSRIILVANILGQTPDPDHVVDMFKASKALDLMMEMILIKRFASPLATVLTLMEVAAPVFRRACPESPEQLVNLPNVLLSGNVNLQNFVVIDILLSVTMARPMLFKYDTTYTPDTFHRLMSGECGFEWLYGIPDQFIVLFAWINSLAEDYGPNVDPQYITRIEDHIREAKTKSSGTPSSDAVLCGACADDPRVMKCMRSFIRLVDGVEPGRNPDFFLFIPIITIGAFVQNEEDRSLIRERLLGLRECSIPGVAGNVCLRALAHVWEQADFGQRAPGWGDLTAAYYSLIHV
ncbi:hypothetical protein BN14_07729 [Rhizoctonia solani AG-1 IB]|uniref:Fungal zn(2)-Cys(6) binuclear cluster domain-containing protein n=1 Tax=Thanatephorus cucumeris (strain AG1-IB / isolate 7/3/14) TaxID=1108050 RepID=M5C2S9_THACB|nr:hypothetical protein BN14_07729 [Rhizoctonia solani AG-1 IB]